MDYEYNALCTKVVDGDTYDFDVDLGFKIHTKQRFRLMGVNTPETYGVKKDSEEYKKGMEAKEFVVSLLEGKNFVIRTFKDKQGKYGRYLCDVVLSSDGEQEKLLSQELITSGLAVAVEY